ncbi:ROK family protein [Marispirochaeta aestuarii]|uniref:ROK family protein n=1 Tax=Marispirochaeta aestuarii TaxID=1963862 RepID=UPI001301DDB4|nr:ROK family protein [Marispirochaeta aestuarii]
MAANTVKIRQINTELIRSALRQSGHGTKKSISGTTGLSVATCGNILKELLESGEVLEMDLAGSTGGRPSRRFVYNQDYARLLMMYLRQEGAEKIIYTSVINMGGLVLREERSCFSEIGLAELESLVDSFCSSFAGLKVIGIGVPGVVNTGIIELCDFDFLIGFPLAEYLQERTGLETVIENDVNCTAIGYFRAETDQSSESLAYIYYPKEGNPGAGIVVNGRILQGNSNFAGEVSYLPLGVSTDLQRKIQGDKGRFSNYVAKTVLSVNAIINPGTIVLSGYSFTPEIRELVLQKVADEAPAGHVPGLIFQEDIHDSYVEGLKYLALTKMSCEFELVRK